MANKRKLHGRAFYESIGSPKVVLAPMVDQSEAAWRLLCRSYSPEPSKLLAYTPMFHSRLFATSPKYRQSNFEPRRQRPDEDLNAGLEEVYLDGHPVNDRPLFVQFCSNSPDDLLAAAKEVEPYCDAVDLNLGCPQGIARRGHYGSFLQEDWGLIHRLISKLHNELSIPVTAKIRILDTREQTLEYARMVLDAGASILTVHGRRREQKGHYTGLADWDVIRYLRDHLPPETVLFANGNILQHRDIADCLEATNADGIMSAEAALTDPTVLAPPPTHPNAEYWQGRNMGGYRIDGVLRRYIDIIYRHVIQCDPPKRGELFTLENGAAYTRPVFSGESLAKLQTFAKSRASPSVNVRVMQAHCFRLLRHFVSRYTDVRDTLASIRVGDMNAFEQVLERVEAAVRDGLLEHEDQEVPDQEPELDPRVSSLAAIQRCKRPFFVCQPYVRPLPAEALLKGAIALPKKGNESMLKTGHVNFSPVFEAEATSRDALIQG